MLSPNMFGVFLIATIALNLSPGPDMLYVISRSLEQGRKAGVVSALGIGAGTLVHTSITALGISAILLSFPLAYNIIRYAGAVYLMFLGFRMLLPTRNAERSKRAFTSNRKDLTIVFRQGIMTNVLNPKVALFFLAFLPQFVDRASGAVALQIVILGLIFDTSGTTWNIIVANLAGRVSESLRRRSGFNRIQELLPAIILLGLGVLIIFG